LELSVDALRDLSLLILRKKLTSKVASTRSREDKAEEFLYGRSLQWGKI
jgi:hypothetical protein